MLPTYDKIAGKMSQTASAIRFEAKLHSPGGAAKGESWTFLSLPKEASDKLPARSMVSVEGTFEGHPFQATLEPDGQGGHWMKVDEKLREAADAGPGKLVALEIAPVTVEPEPVVPHDLQEALANATDKARDTWSSITPLARRDWIYWPPCRPA